MENFKKENLPGLLRLIKEPEDVVEPETDVDPGGVEEGLHHHSQDHQGPGEGGHACFFSLLCQNYCENARGYKEMSSIWADQ
jgi:hypothetical protein